MIEKRQGNSVTPGRGMNRNGSAVAFPRDPESWLSDNAKFTHRRLQFWKRSKRLCRLSRLEIMPYREIPWIINIAIDAFCDHLVIIPKLAVCQITTHPFISIFYAVTHE
jgi:hypothetical protein